jgi:hypothetical protein
MLRYSNAGKNSACIGWRRSNLSKGFITVWVSIKIIYSTILFHHLNVEDAQGEIK